MPLTKLDTNSALIVIDLQKIMLGLPAVHPIEEIVKRAAELTHAFRRHHLPVVLVNVAGTAPGRTEAPPRGGARPDGWTDFLPELNQQPGDLTVTKRAWGAFTNTDLNERLKALGVTHVVLVGVATSIGVESTARQAYEHGFNVTLAIDAVTDLNPDAHINSVTRIFPKLGETGSTRDVLDLLEKTLNEGRA